MSESDFFRVYSGLPRQGPGSVASTKRAISLLPSLPANPRILDLGCGTGAQTRVLSQVLGGRITAIDLHQPFLDELAGADERIETRCVSMDALDYAAESIDLIWSEGAIYLLGVERALQLWRPLLKTGGAMAFSEISWLQDDASAEVRSYWKDLYPAMETAEENCARAARAGYDMLGHFALPVEDWWKNYYTPLRKRCDDLSGEAAGNAGLAAVLAETREEIEMFEQFSGAYSYVFYVLRK